MMKNYLLVLSGILFSLSANAQIRGGEIDYECLGNNRYAVTAWLNAFCGDAISTPDIIVTNGGNTLHVDSIVALTPFDIIPITSRCQALDSCNIDSVKNRVKRHGFRGVVDLSSFTDCHTVFSISQAQATNLNQLSRHTFYIFTEFDRCLAPCDESPKNTHLMPYYVSYGNYINWSPGTKNAAFPEDSFYFHFAHTRNGYDSSVLYKSGYDSSRWISYTGMTGPRLWPYTIKMKPDNGEIHLLPNTKDKAGIMTYRIHSYRNINGSKQWVGSKLIEQQIMPVVDTAEKFAKLNSGYIFQVCYDIKNEFTLEATDENGDSVEFVFPDYYPEGITYTNHPYAGGGKMEITWSPDVSQAQWQPYTCYVGIKDHGCFLEHTRLNYLEFHLNQGAPQGHSILPNVDCQPTQLIFDPLNIYADSNTPTWYVLDTGKTEVLKTTGEQADIYLPKGKYYLEIRLGEFQGCKYTFEDSFQVSGEMPPRFSLTPQIIESCAGMEDSIGVFDPYFDDYRYAWEDGDTNGYRLFKLPTQNGKTYVQVINEKCTVADTFWIYPSEKPDLSRTISWIGKDSLEFKILNPLSSATYFWHIDSQSVASDTGAYKVTRLDETKDYYVQLKVVNYRCKLSETEFVHYRWPKTGLFQATTSEIKVYPNPFKSELYLETEIGQLVRITDLSGKVLLEFTPSYSHSKIDTTPLSPGVYLIQLESEGSLKSAKVVKTE